MGRILDHRGEGIAGAEIDATAELVEDPPSCSGRSGPDGRFRIVPTRPAVAWRLLVRAPRCSPWQVETVFPDQERIIRVDPERRITGTVQDHAGHPVSGAEVTWLGRLGDTPIQRSTTTGAGGEYRIDGVPSPAALWNASFGIREAASQLEVRAPGKAIRLVTLAPEEGSADELQRDLVLPEGAMIEGRVLDDPTGRPVSGARVIAWSETPADLLQRSAPRALGETTTGDDGSFRLSPLPGEAPRANRWIWREATVGWIEATAAGSGPTYLKAPELPDGSRRAIELRLPPAGTDPWADRRGWARTGRARVTVRDPDGRPIEGALVGSDGRGSDTLRTDAAGVAVLPMIDDPLRRDRFLARAPGRTPALTARVQSSAEPPAEVSVMLEPSKRIAGFVRSSDGRPAPGIVVSAASARLDPREFLPDALHDPSPGHLAVQPPLQGWTILESGIVFATCSGADGSFEIVGLPDGPCRVGARGGRPIPGRKPEPFHVKHPDVPAGTLDVILTLPPLPAGPPLTSIEGTVVDAESGEPVTGFEAHLHLMNARLAARIIAPGRFRFEQVPTGAGNEAAAVVVTAAEYLQESLQARVPGPVEALGPLAFRLRRGLVVRGTVTAPEGLDLTGGLVRLEGQPDGPTARIGRDGGYVLSGIDPLNRARDRAVLEHAKALGLRGLFPQMLYPFVDVGRHGPPEAPLVVHPVAVVRLPSTEREVRLDLHVVRGGMLRLRAAGREDGAARDPWHLEVRDPAGALVRGVELSYAQFVAIPLALPLPPGEFIVRLAGKTGPPAQWNVTVIAGQETTLTLAPP